MKRKGKVSKCLHCNEDFYPDPRNAGRQKYCSKDECRKASKQASQQRWLQKPENRNHFCGKDNVERVQRWRKEHPGYWKRSKAKASTPLQDACPVQPVKKEEVEKSPLQDVSLEQWIMKHPLVVGLISHMMDCTLQGDIVKTIRRLVVKGRDILDQPSRTLTKGNLIYDDQKAITDARASAADTASFQLDRPPSDPP
jgi:hypothetical protein